MFRVSPPRCLDVVILSSTLLGALLVVLLTGWSGGWLLENGPLEMLQAGALLAAILLFGRASSLLPSHAGRLAVGLAAVSLLFLVRELPRCGSPYVSGGLCMPGDTKTLAYLLPVPLAALLLVRNRALLPPRGRWKSIVPSFRFVLRMAPLLAVIALLGIGQWADDANWPLAEETSELSAYLLLTLAGLAAAQGADHAHRQPPRHGPAGPIWSAG